MKRISERVTSVKVGLAGEDVSVGVYAGNSKVEYQATALALNELSIEKDTAKMAKVTIIRFLHSPLFHSREFVAHLLSVW